MTQGFNRYAYVNNNPLSFSDPSGYLSSSLFRAVWATTVSSLLGPAGAAISGYVLSGGSGEAAAKAYVAAQITGSIGDGYAGGAFGTPGSAAAIVTAAIAHGVTQGAFSKAGGGRFGDGFLGGFTGSFAGHSIPKTGHAVVDLLVMVTVGGTASKLGGGSFANGAYSAAFVYLFNHAEHEGAGATKSHDGVRPIPANLTDEQRAALDKGIASVNEDLKARHGTFANHEEAAKFLHKRLAPLSQQYDVEIGANIYKGSMPNTVVVFGAQTQYYTNTVDIGARRGWEILADFHTHGSSAYSALFSGFSPRDLYKLPHSSYLSAPNGNLYYFDHPAYTASGLPESFANRNEFVRVVP